MTKKETTPENNEEITDLIIIEDDQVKDDWIIHKKLLKLSGYSSYEKMAAAENFGRFPETLLRWVDENGYVYRGKDYSEENGNVYLESMVYCNDDSGSSYYATIFTKENNFFIEAIDDKTDQQWSIETPALPTCEGLDEILANNR